MSQHVEFFHSLIFHYVHIHINKTKKFENQTNKVLDIHSLILCMWLRVCNHMLII